jgi:hypothetical protein
MAKDRFKANTDRKAFYTGLLGERFDLGCVTKSIAQQGDNATLISRITTLIEDRRITPEARKLLEYWLTLPFGFITPSQARTIKKLEIWRAGSEKQGNPTFGGTRWVVDSEGDKKRRERYYTEKEAKRPDWMRDASKLPLQPPGKK